MQGVVMSAENPPRSDQDRAPPAEELSAGLDEIIEEGANESSDGDYDTEDRLSFSEPEFEIKKSKKTRQSARRSGAAKKAAQTPSEPNEPPHKEPAHEQADEEPSDEEQVNDEPPDEEQADKQRDEQRPARDRGGSPMAVEYSDKQKSDFKAAWKKAKRPLCDVQYEAGVCNGFHPRELCDPALAVAAIQRRLEHQPKDGGKQSKKGGQKANKGDKSKTSADPLEMSGGLGDKPPQGGAGEQPGQEDYNDFIIVRKKKAAKKQGGQPKPPKPPKPSMGRGREREPALKDDKGICSRCQKRHKGDCLWCPTCGRKHEGECRKCPDCKDWHVGEACMVQHKRKRATSEEPQGNVQRAPATASAAAQLAAPQQQTAAAVNRVPMARDEVLQYLSTHMYNHEGLRVFGNLVSNGDREAIPPIKKARTEPHSYADAAQRGNNDGAR